jgi:hypothetical protein
MLNHDHCQFMDLLKYIQQKTSLDKTHDRLTLRIWEEFKIK